MNIIGIIPARFGSSRFPGKPLTQIAGKSMIARVWELSSSALGAENVYVATEDVRIKEHVASFGGKCVITSDACRNGTERCLDALQYIDQTPDAVINIQGDAVLMPPSFITAAANGLRQGQHDYVTIAMPLSDQQFEKIKIAKQKAPASGTFVTVDKNGKALYFSKSILPFVRSDQSYTQPFLKHIGLYGYTIKGLETWCALPPSPLEMAEQLEQLRVLENGYSMQVMIEHTDRTLWAVDSPSDVDFVEDILKLEGEICN